MIAHIFLLLIILGTYIEIVRQNGNTAGASVRLLKTPLFIGGAVLVGLVLPLGLLLYSLSLIHGLPLRILPGITSLLLLVGGLCLRYGVIRSGVYIAVR